MLKAETGGLSSGFLKKGEPEGVVAPPKAPKPAAGLNVDGVTWILLNAFELGAGGKRGGVEGLLLFASVKSEEDVRIPSSGDDGGETAKALCGEPPGVIVVLRDSDESPNTVDLMAGDANGDSAGLLPTVGVPNTEVLAGLSDAFNAVPKVVGELEAKEANPPADAEALGVFSGVVDATGVVPNGAGVAAANALPDGFETLAADAKVVGVLDAKELKAPLESFLSSSRLLASNAEPKVAEVPVANALNPFPVPEPACLISGELKTDGFAGAGELPKALVVLAKAANPLEEVAGVMPKPAFPKAGCPKEDFPKVGDANPD